MKITVYATSYNRLFCCILDQSSVLDYFTCAFLTLKDLCRQIQRKKPQLDDLLKKSEKFLDVSDENDEEHVTELRHLWRDVMLKACSKLRDLQNVLHVMMMKRLHTNAKEEFSETLSECECDVKDLLERLQECPIADVTRDPVVSVAQYEVW